MSTRLCRPSARVRRVLLLRLSAESGREVAVPARGENHPPREAGWAGGLLLPPKQRLVGAPFPAFHAPPCSWPIFGQRRFCRAGRRCGRAPLRRSCAAGRAVSARLLSNCINRTFRNLNRGGCHTFIYNYLLHQSSGAAGPPDFAGYCASSFGFSAFPPALPVGVTFPRQEEERKHPADQRSVQRAASQETSARQPPCCLLFMFCAPQSPESRRRPWNSPQRQPNIIRGVWKTQDTDYI